MTGIKRIGGISFPSRFPIDALLDDLVAVLRSRGLDLGGVVQVVSELPGRRVDMVHLRDLRDGSEVRILQDLGRNARGCRLDSEAIAAVASRLGRTLDEGADLLVINRFGRGEAEGHGLRNVLARAVAADMPVLVAVRNDYAQAWAEFHGGLAMDLPARREDVLAWVEAVCGLPGQMARMT